MTVEILVDEGQAHAVQLQPAKVIPNLHRIRIFFKQKTAYEIMSGDWSSDVCSSDLPQRGTLTFGFANLAAFERFDPRQPTNSRFIDEDLNRHVVCRLVGLVQ